MNLRYLTFDCYGTLIDWRAGIEESLQASFGKLPLAGHALIDAYVAAEMTQEANYQKYREVLRKSALALCTDMGLGKDEDAAVRFAASVPSWPAFPDTAKTLRLLGELGYQRFILSNVDVDLLQETIANSHLEIDGFVTAEEVGSYKPAHGHWTRFMEKTGATKNQFLHVAQSQYHDILPCSSMGIACAWVNRYGEPLLSTANPDFLCDDLARLPGLIP